MTAIALRNQYEEPQWPQPLSIGTRFSQAASERITVERPKVSTPSTTTQPGWLFPTVTRMAELLGLKENWDKRGSAEVSSHAINFAFSILSQTMPFAAPAPSVVPLGHGGIQLLWTTPAADFELEVVQPNEVVAYYVDKATGHEREWTLTTEGSEITHILRSMF